MRTIQIFVAVVCVLLLWSCTTTPKDGPKPPEYVAQQKLEGVDVVIVPDPEKVFQEITDRDALFDNFQDTVDDYMKVSNLKAVNEQMALEAKALGRSAYADPSAYAAERFNAVDIIIYLWLTTDRQHDPMLNDTIWIAKVGCRAVRIQTAQELTRFQIQSGEEGTQPVGVAVLGESEARVRAIKEVAKAAGQKFLRQIGRVQTGLEKDLYTLRFANFDNEQRSKIERAVSQLTTGQTPYCKVQRGGESSGGAWSIQVKWIRSGESQEKVAEIVKEFCANQEVSVDVNQASPHIITFAPPRELSEG